MRSDNLIDFIRLPAESLTSNGTLITTIALSAINPSHPSVPQFLKNDLFRSKIRNDFIDDGLTTGHIKEINGKLIFKTKRDFPSFFGYMMEAYIVRILNIYASTIGHAAKLWAANLSTSASYTVNYKTVGTGFHTTKNNYPGLHSPTDSMDLKFVKKRDALAHDAMVLDHLLVADSTQPAGIQIKAITGNEKTEIILPLQSGRYLNVLTCLEHKNGAHSYEECMEELKKMRKSGEVDELEYQRIKNSIRSPGQIGIDQRYIKSYYMHAKKIHANMVEDGVEISRFFDDEKDLATIEIANFTRRNEIFVPDNLDAANDYLGEN